MRILITGGSGLIGSHIAKQCLERGYTVHSLDNQTCYPFCYLDVYHHIEKDVVKYHADISNAEQCEQVFSKSKPDYVIHCAAYADVGGCIKNYSKDFNDNVIGTQNMLEISRKYNVKKFVFVSSASVYGNKEVSPYTESDVVAPISTYANSKLWGETQTILFNNNYNLPATAIRYFSVYGSPQLPKRGSHSWCIPIFTYQLISNKPITIYGDGMQIRDFTHVSDIAHGTILALESSATCGEVLNLGTGIKTSINEVARYAAMFTQTFNGVKHLKPIHGDPTGGYASIEKCSRLLKWRPEIQIADGIREHVEWISENYNKSPFKEYLKTVYE